MDRWSLDIAQDTVTWTKWMEPSYSFLEYIGLHYRTLYLFTQQLMWKYTSTENTSFDKMASSCLLDVDRGYLILLGKLLEINHSLRVKMELIAKNTLTNIISFSDDINFIKFTPELSNKFQENWIKIIWCEMFNKCIDRCTVLGVSTEATEAPRRYYFGRTEKPSTSFSNCHESVKCYLRTRMYCWKRSDTETKCLRDL